MKVTRLVALAGSLVLATGALAACGSSDAGSSASSPAANCTPAHANLPTIESGTLSVGAYVSAPYTVLESEGSDFGGIDGEILTKIAAMECLTLDAKPVDGAAFVESVKSNRVDVGAGGIVYSAERAQVLGLTDTMYVDRLAILAKEGTNYSTLDSLRGTKVGVIQGYLGVDQLQQALGDSVVVYQDTTSLLSDLNAGRIDSTMLTVAEAGFRSKDSNGQLKYEVFQPDPAVPATQNELNVVLPVAQSSTALLDALNADIATLHADGSIKSILQANGIDPSIALPSQGASSSGGAASSPSTAPSS
jgi:polar amino acid transport system substrate-binding protein